MQGRDIRYAFSALALAALTACGGAGSQATPVAAKPEGAAAPAQLRVKIPAAAASASRRRPNFVASTTAGVLVQAYAQSDTKHATLLSQTATDISSGSVACGGQTGTPRSCTVPFNAPSGADTFVVTSYDAAPSGGSFSGAKELGAAIVNKTITAATTNVINVTLGGVLASLQLALPLQQIHGTAASSQNVVVEGLDADGNVIVTDGYTDASGNPVSVALGISPNTGSVFTLGQTSLASPSATGVPLSYNGNANSPFAATLTATAGSIHASAAVTLLGPSFTQYTVSNDTSHISLAPYGASNSDLWFTEPGINKFGSITPSGAVTEYPTSGTGPTGITAGPRGNADLWITDYNSSQIEYVDTSGTGNGMFSTITPNAGPTGIVTGPDGNLWFAEKLAGKIGKVTTTGTMTEYPTGATGSTPVEIAAGSDGNLWFADPGANAIGKITTSGTVTMYTVPSASSLPACITAGPDGRLWFTESSANKIGAITTGGAFSEYPIPTAISHPDGIIAGPDGNLWFVENGGNKLARITTAGTVTEYQSPASGSVINIAVGSDNNLWFTTFSALKIDKFSW